MIIRAREVALRWGVWVGVEEGDESNFSGVGFGLPMGHPGRSKHQASGCRPRLDRDLRGCRDSTSGGTLGSAGSLCRAWELRKDCEVANAGKLAQVWLPDRVIWALR